MRAPGRPVEFLRDRCVGRSLAALAAAATIEMTPGQIAAAGSMSPLLVRGTGVYVPFLPAAEFSATLRSCERLLADGLNPVPHLPARTIASHRQLDEWLSAIAGAGVSALMLIAGDRAVPAGAFADTLGVLDSGLLEQHGFRRLGIAGHPEGHPVADERALEAALLRKLSYQRATGCDMWLVTQFVFEAAPLAGWLRRIRELGCGLPVHVGIPGPARLKTVISYAIECGAGASARLMARRPGAARLLKSWTPDRLARDLALHRLAEPDSGIAGLHLFPFGGVIRAVNWLHDVQALADPWHDKRSKP